MRHSDLAARGTTHLDTASLVILIGAIASAVVYIVSELRKHKADVVAVADQVEELHVHVNDRLTQLLASTAEAARARGMQEEAARAAEALADAAKEAKAELARAVAIAAAALAAKAPLASSPHEPLSGK